jgi:putative oligomerization/nucleic acid binding protein
MPEAVATKLAQLGIVAGGPMQVVAADSVEGRAALAAFTSGAAPAEHTPEARLVRLESLHERGLLTADEYAEQRRRILDEL